MTSSQRTTKSHANSKLTDRGNMLFLQRPANARNFIFSKVVNRLLSDFQVPLSQRRSITVSLETRNLFAENVRALQ